MYANVLFKSRNRLIKEEKMFKKEQYTLIYIYIQIKKIL